MKQPYDAWIERKLAQAPVELIQPWTMSRKWERITGGRILSAELTLTAKPSDSFLFIEKIIWPVKEPSFRHSVLDGILDGILIDLACVPNHVSFTLENIKWHDEYSVPNAYYAAARELVGEIFAANEKAKFG